MAKKTKKKKSMLRRVIIVVSIILSLMSLLFLYEIYSVIYKPNIFFKDKEKQFFYIPTGSTFEDVEKVLDENNLIKNHFLFRFLADKMNYTHNVKPGKYKLRNRMSNKELLDLLRSGKQNPVKFTLTNLRDKKQLAEKISSNIEASKKSMEDLLNDNAFLNSYGFNKENILSIFIPNTYEMYWNTSAIDFMKRMEKEYNIFWNEERKIKADNLKLTPVEVSILASIVEMESGKSDERPIIASVYLNRLKKGMLLQADPTVIFSAGDYKIKRVTSKHLAIDSPYNTYVYKGLPPGPICIPSINAIESVLDFKKTDFLYFCAKEDFSGFHNFAVSLEEHKVNARKFQRMLNKRKINN